MILIVPANSCRILLNFVVNRIRILVLSWLICLAFCS